MRQKWMQAVTLGLCAVLLGLTLWQNAQITNLQNQLDNARNGIQGSVNTLYGRVTALESRMEEGEKLVRDWELTPAGMDKEAGSLLTECSLTLKEWRADTEVWLTARQGSDANLVFLENTGSGRFAGSLPVSLTGGALSLEIRISSDEANRQEELGSWDDIALLLPLRITGTSYGGPTYQDGVFSLDSYTVDLTDQNDQPAAAEEPVFSLRRNGETAWEAKGVMPEDDWSASGLSPEEAREAGFLRDGAYSTGGAVEVECQPGDTLALFFTCRDEYGLKYTFPLESWEVDPNWMTGSHSGSAAGGGSIGPAAGPVLSWD